MLYNIADHVSHCLFTINIVYYSAPVIPVTASVLYPGLDTYADYPKLDLACMMETKHNSSLSGHFQITFSKLCNIEFFGMN